MAKCAPLVTLARPAVRVSRARGLSMRFVVTASYSADIVRPQQAALEVKRSKFLASAWPVHSAEEAAELIRGASDASASHNCYAYKIGAQVKSSDDGEPGGTAGRPILSAIEAEGLDNIACLVVRHYGGTKLGTGGLSRAYGEAARACLREGERETVYPQKRVVLTAPVDFTGVLYEVLGRVDASDVTSSFSADGCQLTATVRADQTDALEAWLREASRARAALRVDQAPTEGKSSPGS